MAMTLSEELALVETALSEVLTSGQSMSIRDRVYHLADLKELRDWRTDVKNRINAESTQNRTLAEF